MFVVTLVFLAAFIFTVQAALSLYSVIDLADAFQENEPLLLQGVVNSFDETISSSVTCDQADDRLKELEAFLEKKIIRGSSLDIVYTLDCAQWTTPPATNLTVRLRSEGLDVSDTVSI